MCICGSGCERMCKLTWVIYKLKCLICKQCYIGKTARELNTRISEHIRAVEGRGGYSALCRHECRGGYEVRVLARSKGDSRSLRLLEGKMMNKYCPKINIRNETRAREEASAFGAVLRNKEKCKPARELTLPKDDPDSEDGAEDYWIEDSDFVSTHVETEDEYGDDSKSEPDRSYGSSRKNTLLWNPQNYALLKAAKVHEHSKPFQTTDLNSQEAIDFGIVKSKERSFWKKLWYLTPIGIWFDDERTMKDKLIIFGVGTICIAAILVVRNG